MVLTEAKSCPSWILANDGETGYYQIGYNEALLEKTLADKGSHLSLSERVGVLGNVDSLIGTGDISPRVALKLAVEFSNDPNGQVVASTVDIASLVKGKVVPDELRAKGAQFVRQVFGKQATEWAGPASPVKAKTLDCCVKNSCRLWLVSASRKNSSMRLRNWPKAGSIRVAAFHRK